MIKYTIQITRNLKTTEAYEGKSIETKVRKVMSTGEPIEAVSPMIYTERKNGVLPETNIRTDKWSVAQDAMDSITVGIRTKRSERMNALSTQPAANSEPSAQQ